MKKFIITEDEKKHIKGLYEQTTTGATQTTPKTGTEVVGPFGTPPIQYYIYNKGGKYYIYQTNASQKTPILMQGTLWSNNGQGYSTQGEAIKIIQEQLGVTLSTGSTSEVMM